jgi:hypothetical protein
MTIPRGYRIRLASSRDRSRNAFAKSQVRGWNAVVGVAHRGGMPPELRRQQVARSCCLKYQVALIL